MDWPVGSISTQCEQTHKHVGKAAVRPKESQFEKGGGKRHSQIHEQSSCLIFGASSCCQQGNISPTPAHVTSLPSVYVLLLVYFHDRKIPTSINILGTSIGCEVLWKLLWETGD